MTAAGVSHISSLRAIVFANFEPPHLLSHRVLLVFNSGFTALNVWLDSQGKDAPERMSTFLNEYFDQMIKIIVLCGGDIIKFGKCHADNVLTQFTSVKFTKRFAKPSCFNGALLQLVMPSLSYGGVATQLVAGRTNCAKPLNLP